MNIIVFLIQKVPISFKSNRFLSFQLCRSKYLCFSVLPPQFYILFFLITILATLIPIIYLSHNIRRFTQVFSCVLMYFSEPDGHFIPLSYQYFPYYFIFKHSESVLLRTKNHTRIKIKEKFFFFLFCITCYLN